MELGNILAAALVNHIHVWAGTTRSETLGERLATALPLLQHSLHPVFSSSASEHMICSNRLRLAPIVLSIKKLQG